MKEKTSNFTLAAMISICIAVLISLGVNVHAATRAPVIYI